MNNPTPQQVRATLAALDNLTVEGTPVEVPGKPFGPYRAWRAPWFVIDRSTADPEVGYPGEPVAGPFDSLDDARAALAVELMSRILGAVLSVPPPSPS